jgi:hypothetical protein
MLIREVQRALGIERATRNWLLFVVIPLWLGSGLADWYHHRKTHIERTAGTRESAIHVLMLAEAGLPALLGLFLEVNAGVLLIAVLGLIAHEVTAIWDVSYAEVRRRVTPTEQHVHSFLEVVPVMAVSFLGVLHWEQARSLLSPGRTGLDLGLHGKRHPLGRGYVAGLLVAIGVFGAVPYAEELLRCFRVDRTLAPRPEAAIPPTETLRIPA